MRIQRTLLGFALALTLGLAAAPRADAGFGIGGSLGTGFYDTPGGITRSATNIELLPHWKISIISIDLGMKFNFEEPRDFSFRPGVRISIPVLPIYFRAAIPLTVNNEQSYGFLFGAGFSMGVGPISIFAEADAAFTKGGSWNNGMEVRAGVLFGF